MKLTFKFMDTLSLNLKLSILFLEILLYIIEESIYESFQQYAFKFKL